MEVRFKKKLTVALAVCAMACAAVAAHGIEKVSVNADAATETAWLADGASVRYGDKGNGLRFTFQTTAYDENATYGILIAPNSYTKTYALNAENVFGANGATAKYNWAVKDVNGEWVYTAEAGKKQIINLETEGLVDKEVTIDGKTVAVKEFYGSIINLLDGTYDEVTNPNSVNNIAREFRAVGYIRTGSEGNYSYQFVGDEDNVRSMAYVAQRAIEYTGKDELSAEAKQSLDTMYVSKVTNQAASFTQEYYLEQEDGSFVKAESLTDVLNTYNSVATTIDDEVEFVAKEIDGYVYDESNENAKLSGKVYANDKLVLKGYYKKVQEPLFEGTLAATPVSKNNVPSTSTVAISGLSSTATFTRTDGKTDWQSTKKVLKLADYPIADGQTASFTITTDSNWISLFLGGQGVGGVNAKSTVTVNIQVDGGTATITANGRTITIENFTNLNQLTIGPDFKANSYTSFTWGFSALVVDGVAVNAVPVKKNSVANVYTCTITDLGTTVQLTRTDSQTSWHNTQKILKLADFELKDGQTATFTVKNTSSRGFSIKVNGLTNSYTNSNQSITVTISKVGGVTTIAYGTVTGTATIDNLNQIALGVDDPNNASFSLFISPITITVQ